MISSKSSQEVKIKSDAFLAETAKHIKMAGAGSTDGGKDTTGKVQAAEDKEDQKSVEHPKMKKLENQNKILIGVLVAIVVINLILRLF